MQNQMTLIVKVVRRGESRKTQVYPGVTFLDYADDSQQINIEAATGNVSITRANVARVYVMSPTGATVDVISGTEGAP